MAMINFRDENNEVLELSVKNKVSAETRCLWQVILHFVMDEIRGSINEDDSSDKLYEVPDHIAVKSEDILKYSGHKKEHSLEKAIEELTSIGLIESIKNEEENSYTFAINYLTKKL
ncbi:MAG: hypothetical protein GYA87_01680 [Christensenellaceae bacterium]|nr:hypothetical protein [Christensenellaceae bacterium]